MPQMMPINWLIFFLFFIMIYLIFNIMNYYNFNIKLMSKNKNINFSNKMNNFFSWKW